MALTWQQNYTKTQRLAKSSNADDLVQIKQDLNTGYQLFNAKLSRYFSRKQQFTNVVDGQSIYQTPVDSIRIIGMTVKTATGDNAYAPPIKEIRSEYEWRLIKTTPNYASSWITYYYVLGSDEVEVWPVPSTTIANGIRFYYQQQDFDFSMDDMTNTTTGATVSLTNGGTTVTASSAVFTTPSNMLTQWFQVSSQTNTTWYEIVGATTSTLTLKSAYVGPTVTNASWRTGQMWILPKEYTDVPMHYALGNFFSAQGNEGRSKYHMDKYDGMTIDAVDEYSSSTEGNVLYSDGTEISPWVLTPLPGINP